MTTTDVDALAASTPYACALLTILKRYHSVREQSPRPMANIIRDGHPPKLPFAGLPHVNVNK